MAQARQDIAHALADREPLALDVVVGEHLRARHHVLEGEQHLLQRELRQRAHDLALLEGRGRRPDVTLQPLELVDPLGGALEALVLLQPPHQLGARIELAVLARAAAAAAACAI